MSHQKSLSSWTKTGVFAVVACLAVGLAAATHSLTQPATPKGFETIGEEFYPEFTDPLDAKSLRLVTYNEETSVIKPFEISFKEGRYRIEPYGYPADADEQMAKTASSVIGIRREGLAGRRESQFERFGVIDPLSESSALKGRGQRITLRDASGKVLADYIIGKPVEGPGPEGYYYVRTPKDNETYRAKVDLDISTKFSDWIESDLLTLGDGELRRIEINDYSYDEDQGTITGRDQNILRNDPEQALWTLNGLNEQTEQLEASTVSKLTQTLRNLKIIGVRPQPKGLNPDLTLDPQYVTNQLAAEELVLNLTNRGFLPIADQTGKPRLFAKEGQITAVTDQGVAYDLYFGNSFTGTEFDLEVGEQDANKPKQLSETVKREPQTGRYLFIAARFVPSVLGSPPSPPTNPPKEADSKGLESKETESKETESAAATAQKEYETAKAAYETQINDAKKRVEELNDRFRGWYYVISTENFDNLRPSREDLVTAKPASPASPPGSPSTGPPSSAGPQSSGGPQSPPGPAMTPDPATPPESKPERAKPEPPATPEPEPAPATGSKRPAEPVVAPKPE